MTYECRRINNESKLTFNRLKRVTSSVAQLQKQENKREKCLSVKPALNGGKKNAVKRDDRSVRIK